MCDELQRFKYENENRLKPMPGWTSVEWNGGGYSAKNVLGAILDGGRSFSTLGVG